MLRRTLFTPEHHLFREAVERFIAREVAPAHAQWEKDGVVDRAVWLKAGAAGLLCCSAPESYGGPGGDFLNSVIVMEELAKAGASGPGFWLHSEIVAPYILHYGHDAQKERWLPDMAAGRTIAGIAMTEPGAGSDLQAITTYAEAEGDDFVIHGQKVFITNGQLGDVFVVAVKTDRAAGGKGVSLLIVDAKLEGFRRGRNLEKLGYRAQDTSELFFDGVRVPKENLLGELGRGFALLMQELPRERLLIAAYCQAKAEAAFAWTLSYAQERRTFGKALGEHQHIRFELADMQSKLLAMRAFVDSLIGNFLDGLIDTELAAAGKLRASELLCEVVDRCVQIHGGWGYMWEFPITRAYADARVERIAGGSSEMMKEIIARGLGRIA